MSTLTIAQVLDHLTGVAIIAPIPDQDYVTTTLHEHLATDEAFDTYLAFALLHHAWTLHPNLKEGVRSFRRWLWSMNSGPLVQANVYFGGPAYEDWVHWDRVIEADKQVHAFLTA